MLRNYFTFNHSGKVSHGVPASRPCSALRRCQPAIKLIRERLSILGAEVRWSSSDLPHACNRHLNPAQAVVCKACHVEEQGDD